MTDAVTDTLIMIAELEVRPERRAAFMAYTLPNLAVSRAWPGNLAFDMLIDPARPCAVLFHEEWDSPASQQAYMAWRTGQGDLEMLLSFLAGPPTFRAMRLMEP